MGSRKLLIIIGLVTMALGYLAVPIFLGLSEDATDILAAALLPLAICVWAYEEHRDERPSGRLLGVLVPAFLAMFSIGAWVLLSGVRFGVLIPINAVIGGGLYWFIDKHIPAGPD